MFYVVLLFVLIADLSLAVPYAVNTTLGIIHGDIQSDCAQRFLGIPYAKPPIGDLRFRPAVALNESWAQGFDAISYGITFQP